MRYISDIVKGLSADGLFLFEPSEQNERRNIMYTDIFDALRYTDFRIEEAKKKIHEYNFCQKYFGIRKVIFSCPATIVLWNDGTKTVVKSGDYDVFDPEKGLAMAIAKRRLVIKETIITYLENGCRKKRKMKNLVIRSTRWLSR